MKFNFRIIILLLLLFLIFSWCNSYIKESFNNYGNLYSQEKIPKVIISTYHTKSKIPDKVFSNIQRYAYNYKFKIFDDSEIIIFLKRYYSPAVLETFKKLKGAHKADLFRYCYLYKFGGIYLDIKTELIKNIDDVFNIENVDLYTVLSMHKGTVYQGIIASKPNNHLFKELIDYMVSIDKPVKRYFAFTADFYRRLQKYCNKKVITPGYNKTIHGKNFYLFQEKCTRRKCDCKDGLDRYKRCCHVYNGFRKVIKTRYADYPWK